MSFLHLFINSLLILNRCNMLTFRTEIMPYEQKSDKTYNVKIRITYQRRIRRISTSIFVTKDDLTKSFKLKNPRVVAEADKLIKEYQSICSKLQVELNNYSIDDIINLLKEEKTRVKCVDFLKFSYDWINTTSSKGAKNYKSAINAFASYLGTKTLDINRITSDMLKGFSEYLVIKRENRIREMAGAGKRIPSDRMVSLYLGSIRHLFNLAKKQYNDYDKGIIVVKNSPFEHFEVPKQESARKRALSADIVFKVWTLPYVLNSDGKERKCRYNLAKDCFILSFCLIGMNSVDLYNASEMDDNTIIYNRTKTAERRSDRALMKVNIPFQIRNLIEKYRDRTSKRVFDFYQLYSTASSFNRAINYGLKEIGRQLGVDDLEYYAARHSWATLAINQAGVDKYTVHSALNHIDTSMKVTDIYILKEISRLRTKRIGK